MLIRTSTQPLTDQLAQRFAERIHNRLLAPGAKLPSVRQCAQQQGVSPSTVVAAYDQLLARGLVDARKHRGFFVRELTPPFGARPSAPGAAASPHPVDAPLSPRPAPMSAATLIRGMFRGPSDKAQPGTGVLPSDWLETDFLPAAVRRVATAASLNSFSVQYGEPAGDADLRRALSQRLASQHVVAGPDQIITSVGATHALDIVSRTLLRPGDAVMVEEPGWAVEFARLSSLGMRILPVPRGPEGPDLGVMATYCAAHQPRLYVSVSVLHNPTGYSLTPSRAHRVLQLAQAHDFHILEDDSYGHIAPAHATRLSALDGLQRTVYVGGFSKVLVPNWRIGFMAASPGLIERLLDTKMLSTLTTPALLEKALAWCIDQGQLRRHAERIRMRLDQARARSVCLAEAAGCRFAAEPHGLFGWVDTGVDTDALSQRLMDEDYLIAPGSLFHAVRAPSTLMRINFATSQDAHFWSAFKRLRGRR